MTNFRTVPDQSTRMPGGIKYIVGNEAAERFSFYGMKGILTVFMTQHLMDSSGALATLSEEQAKSAYHLFTAAAYFFPIIGSLISDILWGKYKTIIILSLGYCIGHACLAIMDLGPITGGFDMKPWLIAGLLFIAVGAGGIKPCVSAHVGDQFGTKNQHLVSKVFSWFYFSINVGAMASTLLTPILLAKVGPWAAFGLPGVLMALATFVFWLGRNTFVHVPAAGWARFKEETLSRDGLRAVLNLSPIFLIFIPLFWALFDQTGSAWVLQATKMDRHFLGVEWYESQIQAVNPFLILVLIPVFAYVVYPTVDKVFKMTPLRKISIGFFMTFGAFVVPAMIEENITGGDVVATTSTVAAENMRAPNLIDGQSDGAGWSSAAAPTDDVSQEVLIRLRERRAWDVDAVEIDPRTVMTITEVMFAMEAALDQADDAAKGELEATIAQLEQMDEDGAPMSEIIAAGRAVAGDELALDAFAPRTVRLFIGDFSEGTVPGLRSDIEAEHAGLAAIDGPDEAAAARMGELQTELGADVAAYHSGHGWTEVGTLHVTTHAATQRIEFPAAGATHVLVRIESNHGGSRVKLGEIRVETTEPIGAAPERGASDEWPNVAALGHKPKIGWQFLAYILLTAAEVMVSITALEFAYTQAPRVMKSFIMGIYFLGVSLGNFFTSGVNFFIQNADGTSKLEGASYYWFFTALMGIGAVIFVFYATQYKGRRYVQGEKVDAAVEASYVDPDLAGPHGEHGQS